MPSRARSAGKASFLALEGSRARENQGIDEICMRDDLAVAPLIIMWTVS